MKKQKALTPKAKAWAIAKKKYRLSAEVVEMAQALGMNPKKLGKLANHKAEPWKLPLPAFIHHCYNKRFNKN